MRPGRTKPPLPKSLESPSSFSGSFGRLPRRRPRLYGRHGRLIPRTAPGGPASLSRLAGIIVIINRKSPEIPEVTKHPQYSIKRSKYPRLSAARSFEIRIISAHPGDIDEEVVVEGRVIFRETGLASADDDIRSGDPLAFFQKRSNFSLLETVARFTRSPTFAQVPPREASCVSALSIANFRQDIIDYSLGLEQHLLTDDFGASIPNESQQKAAITLLGILRLHHRKLLKYWGLNRFT